MERSLPVDTGERRSFSENEKDAAYEYLCRLEESRKWMEDIIEEPLPVAPELEECLANGVYLCKLGRKLLPNEPQWNKIYDINQERYRTKGLDFRHTDNINFFLQCLQKLGLPKVFYPSVPDIYQQRNIAKLIYCLHALSHLLHKKGKTMKPVDGLSVMPQFSDDALCQVSRTLRQGNMPVFDDVEDLIEEELQYAAIGISDREWLEEEELMNVDKPSNGSATAPSSLHGKPDEEVLFDEPKYTKVKKRNTANGDVTSSSPESMLKGAVVSSLKCNGAGISVCLLPCSDKHLSMHSKLEEALKLINISINKENSANTLKALQNSDASLPFPFLESEDYHAALNSQKHQNIPTNVLPVYFGLTRALSDTLLDRMKPGAYLVRQSSSVAGTFVFSFRNKTGIKHWQMSQQGGKFCWAEGTHSCDTLDTFIQCFVEALEKVTKLYVYYGCSFMLELNSNAITPDQAAKLHSIRQAGGSQLNYGQVVYVIKDVNSQIRKSRRDTRERLQLELSAEQAPSPDEDTWDQSMVVTISRAEAEKILETEGHPGSFLVRPSEKVAGHYALAFRTRSDIRNWKIVQKGAQYLVHPRPHLYNTMDDVVQHFRDAVGAETGLVMVPMSKMKTSQKQEARLSPNSSPACTPTRSAPLSPNSSPACTPTHSPARSSTIARTVQTDSSVPQPRAPPIPRSRSSKKSATLAVQPSPSLSKLNPANITSWSVNDVGQWLLEQGLGKFIEVFEENAIDGECLLQLDNTMLKDDLGISQLGYRTRITSRVNSLRQSVHPQLGAQGSL